MTLGTGHRLSSGWGGSGGKHGGGLLFCSLSSEEEALYYLSLFKWGFQKSET